MSQYQADLTDILVAALRIGDEITVWLAEECLAASVDYNCEEKRT